jgi:hypothetical protein
MPAVVTETFPLFAYSPTYIEYPLSFSHVMASNVVCQCVYRVEGRLGRAPCNMKKFTLHRVNLFAHLFSNI